MVSITDILNYLIDELKICEKDILSPNNIKSSVVKGVNNDRVYSNTDGCNSIVLSNNDDSCNYL